MEDEIESVLFVCREVYVYKIPPRTSNEGYRAANWGDMAQPIWKGRLRVIETGSAIPSKCTIRLEDAETGELFAQAPHQPSKQNTHGAVEAVLDSSRYFVLTVVDIGSGQRAFLGLGFPERTESFDFNVALQDWAKRQTPPKAVTNDKAPTKSPHQPSPGTDFSLKPGETFKISIGGKSTKTKSNNLLGEDSSKSTGSSVDHTPQFSETRRDAPILPPKSCRFFSMDDIDREARKIVYGYPLAAGLIPTGQVAELLPTPSKAPDSQFVTDGSLQEPVFDQYRPEIEALLAESDGDGNDDWRAAQWQQVAQAVHSTMPDAPAPSRFMPPPFSVPALSGTSSNALVSDLTKMLNLPLPVHENASAPLSRPFVTPSQAAEYLEHQIQSRTAPPAAPSTDTFSQPRESTVASFDASSPDPLRIVSNGGPQSKIKRVIANGKMYTELASSLSPPSVSRKRSSLFNDGGSPLKRHCSSPSDESSYQSSPYRPTQERLTESQRAALNSHGKVGVESAVKNFNISQEDDSAIKNPALASSKSSSKLGTVAEVLDSLSTLVSDIVSVDNSLVGDTSDVQVGSSRQANQVELFFRQSSDGRLLLRTATLKKLQIQFSFLRSKRKGEEMLEEVGEGGLAGLMRIVERSWRAVEDTQLWDEAASDASRAALANENGTMTTKQKKTPSIKRRASSLANVDDDGDFKTCSPSRKSATPAGQRSSRSRSTSRSPQPAAAFDGDLDMKDDDEDYWTSARVSAVHNGLRDWTDAVLATRLALTVLSSTQLPKSFYSMDFIGGVLSSQRACLDQVIWPLLEANPASNLTNAKNFATSDLTALLAATETNFPDLADLLKQERLPEDFVISSTYFALSPFLHESVPSSTVSGRSAKTSADTAMTNGIKSMRIAALVLIRTLVSRYPDQRLWIVEEVLNYATRLDIARKVKGAIRLRNGASIHTISALLLQLVQSCPPGTVHDMDTRVKRGLANDLKPIFSQDTADQEAAPQPGVGTVVRLSIYAVCAQTDPWFQYEAAQDILAPVTEGSAKAAHAIFRTLLQKSCRLSAKSVAGSSESEYKVVLDNLMTDLVATLNSPEWPAAEVMLSSACRLMLAAMSDTQSSAESNSLKTISIDHIGAVAARLRLFAKKVAKVDTLKSLADVTRDSDVKALEELVKTQRDLVIECKQIERRTGDDESASEFAAVVFGEELANAERAVSSALAGNTQMVTDQAKAFHEALRHQCESYWSFEDVDDVFGWSPSKADELAVAVAQVQPLARMYESLLEKIIDALDSSSVTLRTKALRSISAIIAEDDSVFNRLDVRRSLQNRMLDSSPSVRDATLELTGKYVVLKPDVAADYLPTILDRLTDTSLAVRRRAIKLAKILYSVVPSQEQRIAICKRLVWRILDEDENVKELVLDSIEELWFSRSTKAQDDRAGAEKLTEVMVKTIGKPTERGPPVEDALKMIMARANEKGRPAQLDSLRPVVNGLTQGLLEDNAPFSLAECVKTVYTLHLADASLLEPAKASILLPFLRNASNREEQIVSDYLVKIFKSMVVSLPKTSLKLARDLQDTLVTMINKPTAAPGSSTLQDIVSCFCAVVKAQTKDYDRLLAVFKACYGRLGVEVRKTTSEESIAQINKRTLPMLAFLTALVAENANFDEMRLLQPELTDAIDKLSPKSIHEQTYHMLVRLYDSLEDSAVRSGLLSALSCLFRAYPQLMVSDATSRIFKTVFESGTTAQQIQLLRIIHDFLSSQERAAAPIARRKESKKDKGVKFEELVGTVEGFADSGVPSAVCHIYMSQIVTSATSVDPVLRQVGAEILFMIARSGFGHPLELAPSIVALTAGAENQTSAKAFSALAAMLQKHATLLASRYLHYFRAAFDFSARLEAPDSLVRGWSGNPLGSRLGRWYSLLQKEKRQFQLDFLKAAGRIFDVSDCTPEQVTFVRWMAEALSTLEFKRNEEVLQVIASANKCLAVSGIQVMHILQGDSVSSQFDEMDVDSGKVADVNVARQSIVCGLALLLRDHLKKLYSISDAQVTKYVPGKKSSFGDKAAVRNSDALFALGSDDYPRMPLATSLLDSPDSVTQQAKTYVQLINEDGTLNSLNELEYDQD